MENPLIRMKHMITQATSNCCNKQVILVFSHGVAVGINQT